MKMNENSLLKMVQELSSAFGPSGFEDDVVKVIRKYIMELGEIQEDSLRNLYLYRRENKGNKPIIMLDAHSDEVGLIVQSINANGTLRFIRIGSWNKLALPSMKVLIRNAKGQYVPGIVSIKTVHFMNSNERNSTQFDYSDLCIDIGSSSRMETIEKFHIRIGEPIVPDINFSYDDENDLLFGKAFDCRIGCVALIETLKRIQNIDLPFDIVGVFSAQEEVGNRGCKVAVNHIKPSLAICFEGAPADDMLLEPLIAQTKLRNGPMLRVMDRSIICNPRFMRFTENIAEKNHIPYQISVREGGGNNGGTIHTALEGIPVIVPSVPVRYIHSPNGIATLSDLENTIDLVIKLITTITIADFDLF